MDLQVAYNQLLFWINKFQGSFYSPEELDAIVDMGQMSYYKDCFVKYGTGQRLTDALANFKKKPTFTTNSSGLLSTPVDYMNLIDIIPMVGIQPVECPVLNEDEITYRRKSQVIPNTTSNPFAEIVAGWDYQLYPMVAQSGVFSYFSRPPKPFFKYTIVSGRVIVYDQAGSTQLGWPDDEIQPLLIWTLQSIGINLDDQEVSQFAELKTQQNLTSPIKV